MEVGSLIPSLTTSMEYQKRLGTSGVEGQFYETKVIALFLLRLLHDERVADFCLATNMEGMGAFDDICVRVSVVGRERPLALFVQLKHKIHDDASLTIHEDLVKYIDSFVTISNRISSQKDCDYFFDKNISITDNIFILYTNGEFKDTNSALESEDSLTRSVRSYDSLINELLMTGASVGRGLRHSERLAPDFAKSKLAEDVTVLAERFTMYLCDKTKQAHIMTDKHLKQYHVVLARHVVHVGDIQTDKTGTTWRELSFRNEFFESQDEPVALFRRTLFKQILSYKNKVPPETTAEAYLRSLKLNVPVGFGNVDMVMSGGAKKVERRFNYLVTGILDMCQRYERVDSLKVVTIDDTVDGGLLTNSGGLASAVGNLLTWDESTDALMFADRFTPRQSNAEALFTKLKEKIEQQSNKMDHLSNYRFKVQTNKLPKLRLDCTDTVSEFINKLLIYDKQSNQSKVEGLLKDEIQNLLHNKAHPSALQCHSVFLHYHDEVVSWWMRPSGTYLNKANNLYDLAIKSIKAEPQISALHTTFHVNNSRDRGYSFDEMTPNWSALAQLPAHMSIVTDTVTLTTMTTIQCLRRLRAINKYTVFDMENVANLSTADFCSLQEELRKTEKVLIIAWRKSDSGAVSRTTLHELAQATECKQIVIVTNDVDKVYEYFPHTNVFRDETLNFTSMIAESQKVLMKNCKVKLQDVELSLDLLLDIGSLTLVKGVVLEKLIRHEAISLGASLGDPRYEEIKHLYINRNVRRNGTRCFVKTFHDITDGGIVRVNFINHSKQFEQWCDDDTCVSAVKALEFLCRVVIRKQSASLSVQLTNEIASLVNCAEDGLITFELNMFLHYYNQQRLIFVFDGFDEICPHYKDKVVAFLIVFKESLKKNKMWVTSRPYSDILPDLQRALGQGFEIEHLSYREQEIFLKSFWREKSINEKLCKQLERLEAFIENVGQSLSEVDEWVEFIYYNFVDVLRCMLCRPPHVDVERHLEQFRNRPMAKTMSGIPLTLYLMAKYFVNIVDNDKKRGKSKLIINIHDVYETFLENAVKNTLFQDKNNMDLSNPITKDMLERELHDRKRVYKKLAANALFQDSIFRKLSFKEFEDMTPIDNEELCTELNRIKTGADKTGLIFHVTEDNLVIFIHRSFTEYYAAEYACDILKSLKYNKSKKLLWYCALTFLTTKGIRDWIEIKKKIDETLQNVIQEIEEPSPAYTTGHEKYLFLYYLSDKQRIRILASSEDDYDNFSFTTLKDAFAQNWATDDNVLHRIILEYLQNYIINQMKIHLKEHFLVRATFKLINNNFVTCYYSFPDYVNQNMKPSKSLEMAVVGQEGDVPLLLRLEHKHDDDAIDLDDSCFKKNNQIVLTAYSTCNSIMYILYQNEIFTEDRDTAHEPDSVREFDTLMDITNTVRCRLHYSEQNIQEFANILLLKELSFFVWCFESQTALCDFVKEDLLVFLRNRCREIFQEKRDLDNPTWQILMLRDEFLDTDDAYIIQLRNYLIEDILNKPAVNLSERFMPDELITSFLSAPSTATLTPLIGTSVVCCKEGQLKILISRPTDDVEQLKRVNMPRPVIDEALSACRIAVVEYLRSLRLEIFVDLADVDKLLDTSPRSVEETVNAIYELCERCDRTDLYKVVTIDDTEYNLTKVLGNVLTFDKQSNMLKFANEHQFTAAQKNTKLIFKKLSDKINDLHEYRFQLKSNKFSKLRADYNAKAREFLDKMVIYTKRGKHYQLQNIILHNPYVEPYEIYIIKSQLRLLHFHSTTVKWWTSLRTSANLTSMSQEGDARRAATRDLYRRAACNVTAEPLVSELHTKFHMNHFKYFENSYHTRYSKWKEILEIPCRTLIETDTVTLTAIEVIQFLRNNDSVNNFTILELNNVFNMLSGIARSSLLAELRQTDKVLIVVWHTPQSADGEILRELVEAINDKNIIVVTNNESRENIRLLGTNCVFKCKTELRSAE